MKYNKFCRIAGFLIGSLLTGFGLVLLVLSALRSTPLFWRSAGG